MKHQEVKWMKMNARMNENDSGFLCVLMWNEMDWNEMT